MDSFEVLQDEKGLQGRDLSRVFETFQRFRNNPSTFFEENPKLGSHSRFKKKEPLEKMAKSIIKHRIQTLTGQNISDIESKLDFSIKAGTTISLEQIKLLAHLMILESNGSLHDVKEASKPNMKPSGSSRKRAFQPDRDTPSSSQSSSNTPVKQPRTSRKSVPGNSLDSPMPNSTSRRSTRRSIAPEMILMPIKEKLASIFSPEIKEEESSTLEESSEEDVSCGLDNPTPQMLAQKRKSIVSKKTANTPPKVKKSPVVVKKKDSPVKKKVIDKGFSGASFFRNEEDEDMSKIYLLNDEVSSNTLNFKKIKAEIPNFEGFNLAVIHTPGHWQPLDMFNAVQALRFVNKDGKVQNYLILIGCGVENVKIFQEALHRFTSHVQFVVFDRQDQNKNIQDGKLRETTTYFLLGYFFPGCQEEDSVLPGNMVRQGMSNCFQAKSIEDLENMVIHAMSEEGDWVLDLGCKSRELCLAAQKTGRFALAFEEDLEKLQNLEQKARLIAKHHNPKFSKDDGMILKL